MKVSFKVIGCLNIPSQAMPGNYIHPSADHIQILQTEINEWKGTYEITIDIPLPANNEQAADIAEETRSRFVAIFAITSRVGATASDELLIESEKSTVAVYRRGDKRDLDKLATPIVLNSFDARIATRKNLEWNALTRLKQAFLSTSFADSFEAFAGAIDILGKIEFPQLRVGNRMLNYLQQRLGVEHSVAQSIVAARNNKIHENQIDHALKAHLYPLLHQLADNLCELFYLPIVTNAPSRMIGDLVGIEYASNPQAQPLVRKVGRNEPCPCKSGKKYKKCCGAGGATAEPLYDKRTKMRKDQKQTPL